MLRPGYRTATCRFEVAQRQAKEADHQPDYRTAEQ